MPTGGMYDAGAGTIMNLSVLGDTTGPATGGACAICKLLACIRKKLFSFFSI
jgi:hypothetical protein